MVSIDDTEHATRAMRGIRSAGICAAMRLANVVVSSPKNDAKILADDHEYMLVCVARDRIHSIAGRIVSYEME